MTTAKLERWSAAVRQFFFVFFSGFRPLGPGVQVFFFNSDSVGFGIEEVKSFRA